MKTISIFDIIGPNMIGPSSSHTAGALKIALLARKICEGKIKKAEFILYGSFAETYQGHGTDRALVAGILGYGTEDLRIRDSFRYAREQGLDYVFIPDTEKKDVHPNTVDIILTNEAGVVSIVTGVSIGGGNAEIHNINGIDVNFTGEYYTILIQHMDMPGVIAHITKCLSEENINIAYLKLYRENKGQKAFCVVEADEMIDLYVLDQIKAHPSVVNTILIH